MDSASNEAPGSYVLNQIEWISFSALDPLALRLPAISFPAGYTSAGLPLGMQAIARPWDEVTLMRLALAAEGVVERQAPKVFYRLLDSGGRG